MANNYEIGDFVVPTKSDFQPNPFVYRITGISGTGSCRRYEITKYDYRKFENSIIPGYTQTYLEKEFEVVRKPSWWDESIIA